MEPDEDWILECLAQHNDARSFHGAPDLEWSKGCYEYAKKQAELCANHGVELRGNLGPSGDHGQNCFQWNGTEACTPEDAVQEWYGEFGDYSFETCGPKDETCNFTQLVWASTTHVGMAISDDGMFVVANYFPAGNRQGMYQANVAPAELCVGEEVDDLGLTFRSIPPKSLVVDAVTPGSWAQEEGINPGDVFSAVNGIRVQDISLEHFESMMQKRPLSLQVCVASAKDYHSKLSDESDASSVKTNKTDLALRFTAGVEVEKLGMQVSRPPNPLEVKKVAPGGWADSQGIVVGDIFMMVNNVLVAELTSKMFEKMMRERPITFDFADQAQNNAAVKIQAIVRGSQTRKLMEPVCNSGEREQILATPMAKVGLERDDAVQSLFHAFNSNGNGRIDEYELLELMQHLGYQVASENWSKEYVKHCRQLNLAKPAVGLSPRSFNTFISTEEKNQFYFTDAQLSKGIETLEQRAAAIKIQAIARGRYGRKMARRTSQLPMQRWSTSTNDGTSSMYLQHPASLGHVDRMKEACRLEETKQIPPPPLVSPAGHRHSSRIDRDDAGVFGTTDLDFIHDEFLEAQSEQAAIKLQSALRGRVARRKAAATRMQHQTHEGKDQAERVKHKVAIQIQSAERGRQARKGITKTQRLLDKYEKQVAMQYEVAAADLQKKREFEAACRQQEAAIKLQSVERGRQSRKRVTKPQTLLDKSEEKVPRRYKAAAADEQNKLELAAAPIQTTMLFVTIRHARNLRNADLFGKSDPYCVCQIPNKDKAIFRTKVIDNTLNPDWNEQGEIAGYEEGDNLLFKVYDQDPMSSDLLGTAELNNKVFFPRGFDGVLDVTYPGSSGAKLSVRIDVSVGCGAAEQKQSAATTHAAIKVQSPYRGHVDRNLAEGRGEQCEAELKERAKKPMLEQHDTELKERAENLKLEDCHAELKERAEKVKLEQRDATPKERAEKFKLEQCEVEHKARATKLNHTAEAATTRPMKLLVTIRYARNLRNADLVGKSDPYCVCRIPNKDKSIFRTKVINNTLHPDWNEQGEIAGYENGDDLLFTIYDKDPMSCDFLGTAQLNSKAFFPDGFDGVLDVAYLGISGAKLSVQIYVKEGCGAAEQNKTFATNHDVADVVDVPASENIGQRFLNSQMFGTPVFLVSSEGKQLEDNNGEIGLTEEKGPCQKWLLADAGEGKIFIVSHRDCMLGDRKGIAGLHHGKAVFSRWTIGDALSGKVFIISHRGLYLADNNGSLVLQRDGPSKQHWWVLFDDGAAAYPFDGLLPAKVRVTVVAARGLRKALLVGRSSPYCAIQIPGKRHSRNQTKVMSNSLEPAFDYEYDVFGYAAFDDLFFEVFDKGCGSVGKVTLRGNVFYPGGYVGELPLQNPHGEPAFLKVKVVVLRAEERADVQHITKAFSALDINGDGRLDEQELYLFAKFLDYPGDAEDWREEYLSLCGERGLDTVAGVDLATFAALVRDEKDDFCCDVPMLKALPEWTLSRGASPASLVVETPAVSPVAAEPRPQPVILSMPLTVSLRGVDARKLERNRRLKARILDSVRGELARQASVPASAMVVELAFESAQAPKSCHDSAGDLSPGCSAHRSSVSPTCQKACTFQDVARRVKAQTATMLRVKRDRLALLAATSRSTMGAVRRCRPTALHGAGGHHPVRALGRTQTSFARRSGGDSWGVSNDLSLPEPATDELHGDDGSCSSGELGLPDEISLPEAMLEESPEGEGLGMTGEVGLPNDLGLPVGLLDESALADEFDLLADQPQIGDEVGFSGEAGLPGELGLPDELGLPEEPGLPDNLGLPDEVGLPDKLGSPENIGLPDEVGLPDKLGSPDNIGLPDEVGLPDELGLPHEVGLTDELSFPDEVGLPEEVGFTDELGLPNEIGSQDSEEF